MRRISFVALVVVLTLAVGGSIAAAAKPGSGSCAGGTEGDPQVIPAGTYNGLLVSGNCVTGEGVVTVDGNLTIADGGILNDHASGMGTVHVTGNVQVGSGGVLGLGDYDPFGSGGFHTSAVVDGNVNAHNPATLYLGNMTVHGNLVSNGGSGPGRNFPIKDNTIGGNLIAQGWTGQWIGFIRNQVGGNVNFSKNTAMDPSVVPGSDSSEVQTNVIAGNLICHGNTPTAQVNQFDGGEPNDIGGNAVGECPPRIVDNPTE